MAELQRPVPPGYYASQGASHQYEADRQLYDLQEKMRLAQEMNPLRGTNLGELAQLSGRDPREMAQPGQYTERSVTEPSAVPSYRYMPTMTQGPEVQGPYDIRQAADQNSVAQPITQHYPQSGAMTQATPQLRQQYNQPIGTMTEGPRPDISYNERDINPQAPSTRLQQLEGMSRLEQLTKWPRSLGAGGSGANTLAAKIQALVDSGLSEDQARQYAVLGGMAEDKTANLQARTGTSTARAENLQAGTALMPRRQHEIERHNLIMEDFRRNSLRQTDDWRRNMQGAQDNKDWIAVQRLNEQRDWHDALKGLMLAVDKNDILSDDQSQAYSQAQSIIGQLDQRDPSPQELTFLESIFGKRPRYEYKPRPKVELPTGKSSSRSSVTESGRQARAATGVGAPVVKDDTDYEKLPSGATFIDPHGKQRKKP